MATLDNHQLYFRNTCPFCVKVLTFMDKHNIDMEMRDVTDPEVSEELVRIGGKKQVPCLVIEGRPLYESDDIITYFKTKIA